MLYGATLAKADRSGCTAGVNELFARHNKRTEEDSTREFIPSRHGNVWPLNPVKLALYHLPGFVSLLCIIR